MDACTGSTGYTYNTCPIRTRYNRKKAPIEEMRLKLNENSTHYPKWTFTNQVWLRYNNSNPGTTVMGEPAASTFDSWRSQRTRAR